MKQLVAMISLLGICMAAAPLARPEEPPLPGPPGPGGAEAREILENLKVWHLTRELEITPELGARFFPLLHELERVREEQRRRREELIGELRQALELPQEQRAARIEELMSRLDEQQEAARKAERQARARLLQELSLEQQAKFLIFEQDFPRYVRKTMRRLEQRRRMAGPRQSHGTH